MKRIRYFRQADNTYKTRPLPARHDVITAELSGLSWKILSSAGEVMANGTCKTEIELKRLVKKELISFGVDVLDEVRQRQ